jgi:sortase B
MHMLIYGHHMKNGSMFGTLTKYKDKSYYEEHPYVYIYYPDRTEQWQVWTAEHVKDTDLVYCMPYISGSPEYEELIAGLQSGSLYETSVGSIDSETGFITLTTCDNTDGSGTGRFIVNIVCTKSISSDGRDLLDTVNHSIFQ